MIPFTPKTTVPLSIPPILFSHFLVLLFTLLLFSPSNSSPNRTIPTNRNFSSFLLPDSDPFGNPDLMSAPTPKKLRRAPHVFSKVLELPLNSDADVSIEERPDFFRFAADFDCLAAVDLRVLIVEPHPGIKKAVIRGGGGGDEVLFDELEVDVWRVRLRDTALPEAANATCRGGRLVVTVPKIGGGGENLLV